VDKSLKAAATSVDVARMAGVSQSAVSLVFGGKAKGRISARAQQAILQAARRLNYRPNIAARALKSGQSRLLVLAVPNSDNPYFTGALKGAEREARNLGYSVTLAALRKEEDWQPVVLDSLLTRSVDGFLIFGMEPPSLKERRVLKGKAVLVDSSHRIFPSILLDLKEGVRSALMHLIEAGHTKIGHLGASIPVETFAVRGQAFLDTLRSAGIPFRSEYEARSPFQIERAIEAATRILRAPNAPSAIFCDSDFLAVGVYKAARALGLTIPQHLSVIGVDDSIIAKILDPELTTVAVPAQEIGETAVRLLVATLKGEDVPSTTTIPLEFIVRNSTAPPYAKSGAT
jgi:LacI family transcriptional regulator, repressor for deo operon, udp, cdd, tsx, nupC, and nupG